ncbi:DUF3293 domain-containing protein [Tepidiforma thermophila]|uniref:DUF3293 domain-containing protein n=1 Tax=Tepidiforma thermophila (strain KCTC 52669 / CGMCC 1.13589 / G233) TaxID=2761530 RepID=UPI000D0A92A3|nr:DUF3293 domain-containing protein [Tepidiforma thermophila]
MTGDSTGRAPDPELEAVYGSAVYEAELPGGRVTFRVGDCVPGAPGPFAIVTAWNPGHERPPREVNEARNAELRSEIERRGWHWGPAEGRSPDGTHQEPSFAVWGAPLDEVLALAREFGQAAVAWFDGERARLAWC